MIVRMNEISMKKLGWLVISLNIYYPICDRGWGGRRTVPKLLSCLFYVTTFCHCEEGRGVGVGGSGPTLAGCLFCRKYLYHQEEGVAGDLDLPCTMTARLMTSPRPLCMEAVATYAKIGESTPQPLGLWARHSPPFSSSPLPY